MDPSAKIAAKFEKLLNEGREILERAGWNGTEYSREYPSTGDYLRFRTEAQNLTRRVCGDDSDHYLELKRIAEDRHLSHNGFFFNLAYGVLEAAFRDFNEGFLFDLRSLVAAELFSDFLDQAEHLLSEDYYVPAASLAGAVLEDSLRKLCYRRDLPVPAKTTIESLNVELAKASVYDKLVQKQITALADIRNNADHGHFAKFTKADVEDMIKRIRRFDADYLQ